MSPEFGNFGVDWSNLKQAIWASKISSTLGPGHLSCLLTWACLIVWAACAFTMLLRHFCICYTCCFVCVRARPETGFTFLADNKYGAKSESALLVRNRNKKTLFSQKWKQQEVLQVRTCDGSLPEYEPLVRCLLEKAIFRGTLLKCGSEP